jgi:hypothetical protein
VRSAAQNAVAAPLAAAQRQAGAADQAAGAAKAAADKASGDSSALGKKLVEKGVLKPSDVAGGNTVTPPPPPKPAVPPAPFDERLTVEVAATETDTQSLTVEAKQALSITDLLYENPQGDTGTVTIRVDDTVLFRKGLANFRDLTDHFVSPIVVKAGQQLILEVQCAAQGKAAPDASCRTALVVVGTIAGVKS